MITYYFGDKDCKLDFNDFLSITTDIKKYKSEFNSFSELYEFIENNKKEITYILFDGYEYFIENGVLHNLYGAAYIRYNNDNDNYSFGTKTLWFYIKGKLVCDKTDTRGCKKLTDFKNGDIYFYKELTNKKSNFNKNSGPWYKRKEGVDYIKDYINLNYLITKDQRYKKLKMLNNMQKQNNILYLNKGKKN